MASTDSEKLEILNWLKQTFDLDTTEEEIEIFGISSNILKKIDELVEVSERFLMENSETRKKLAEIREYFAEYPRSVIGQETFTTEVADNVQKRRYNWIPAPKLEG